jgi:subtilisin family serine protease
MKRLLSTLALAMCVVPAVGLAAEDRYIIKFKDGHGPAGRAAVEHAGGRVALSLDAQQAVAAHLPAAAVTALSNNPHVEYIEEDVIREPMALSNRTLATGEILPYGIQMVQADLITSSNEGGKRICIIDSGYSQQHEDLRDDTGAAITQLASNTGSGTWDKDSCGHGSHVAGTISAIAGNSRGVIGVVPNVNLHIVKIFGDDVLGGGNCAWTYSSTLVDALNKCTAAGSNVVSMSLGGGLQSITERNAFQSAYNSGVLSIAAAGNAGTTQTSYPAGYTTVVSVAAVDANEALATFSQRNKDVEIAAPGVAVLSTVPFRDIDNVTFPDASTIDGSHVDLSARSNGITGTIVDGGLCDTVGSWAGKIVLCQRGTVSFLVKVQNVQSGGGAAAVIYNNAASDATCADFAATLGDGNSSTIPAISVSCAEGTKALSFAGVSSTLVSRISAPDSGYEAWDGTSMATPHVSGVAALIWGCYPQATNQRIRDAMNATAKDKGTAGRDNSYGYGIVQAKAAMANLASSFGTSQFCATSTVSKY